MRAAAAGAAAAQKIGIGFIHMFNFKATLNNIVGNVSLRCDDAWSSFSEYMFTHDAISRCYDTHHYLHASSY